MFSSQIGSPNSKSFLHRPAVHTPFTFRRRSGPLFPTTPTTPTNSSIADSIFSRSCPATPNLSFPGTGTPAPISSPNFPTPTRHVFEDYTNILRWDSDGQLHTVEFFTSKYGGNKSSPPSEWIQAPENLRIDISNGEAYDLLSFIQEYGGNQHFPPTE